MSDREKAIKILEKLPSNISMKDILEALILVFDLNSRIDNFDENEALTTKQLLEEIKEW